MHLDELEDRGAVLVGHPVVGLDLPAGAHVGEEGIGVTRLVGRPAVQRLDRGRRRSCVRTGYRRTDPGSTRESALRPGAARAWRRARRRRALRERATRRGRTSMLNAARHASTRSGSFACSASDWDCATSRRRRPPAGSGSSSRYHRPRAPRYRSHQDAIRRIDHDPDGRLVIGLPAGAVRLDPHRRWPRGGRVELVRVEASLMPRRAERASVADASARTPRPSIASTTEPIAGDGTSGAAHRDRPAGGRRYARAGSRRRPRRRCRCGGRRPMQRLHRRVSARARRLPCR